MALLEPLHSPGLEILSESEQDAGGPGKRSNPAIASMPSNSRQCRGR